MRKVLKALMVLAIAGIGVAIFHYLTSTQVAPGRASEEERPTMVAVTEARPSRAPVLVVAMGSVVPARSVTVFPEVGGRIIYQSPKLMPGGRFLKGQTLARIDPRDYELALKQQQARVVQAEMELARERGLKTVAEREWNLIRDEVQPTAEGKKLALREIQLGNAQAMVDSARSAMELAQLQHDRTRIQAPFNALVTEEFVDVGQVVSPASRIATLVDSDRFWVRASVPMDRLSWIRIPGVNAEEGSPALIVQQAGPDLRVERKGHVIKLEGGLDPKGKMARILVEVDDPLGTPGEKGMVMPLLLDAFVQVEIQGPVVEGVVEVPRLAIRDQNHVFVKTEDRKLAIRKVDVVWSQADSVFVKGELRPGEQIVTSRLATPVEGMLLRSPDEPPPAGAPAATVRAPEEKESDNES